MRCSSDAVTVKRFSGAARGGQQQFATQPSASACSPCLSSKTRGRERKGPPEIIQKCRLRKWPSSSADFPMTPVETTEHHCGPLWEKDFGAISSGPFFSRPLVLLLSFSTVGVRLLPLKTHDCKGFRTDFDQISTGS